MPNVYSHLPTGQPKRSAAPILSEAKQKREKLYKKVVSYYAKLLAAGSKPTAILQEVEKKFGVSKTTTKRLIANTRQ